MKSAFGMCYNWKVLAGLAAIGVALFAFAPGYAIAALPLLLLAACPVSMAFMMFAMRGHGHSGEGHHRSEGSPLALRQRLDALREEERRLEGQLRESELDASPSSEKAIHQSRVAH